MIILYIYDLFLIPYLFGCLMLCGILFMHQTCEHMCITVKICKICLYESTITGQWSTHILQIFFFLNSNSMRRRMQRVWSTHRTKNQFFSAENVQTSHAFTFQILIKCAFNPLHCELHLPSAYCLLASPLPKTLNLHL